MGDLPYPFETRINNNTLLLFHIQTFHGNSFYIPFLRYFPFLINPNRFSCNRASIIRVNGYKAPAGATEISFSNVLTNHMFRINSPYFSKSPEHSRTFRSIRPGHHIVFLPRCRASREINMKPGLHILIRCLAADKTANRESSLSSFIRLVNDQSRKVYIKEEWTRIIDLP